MSNIQYAVCHLQRGCDSGMSCHIERKVAKLTGTHEQMMTLQHVGTGSRGSSSDMSWGERNDSNTSRRRR